jgi:hypothetical protein
MADAFQANAFQNSPAFQVETVSAEPVVDDSSGVFIVNLGTTYGLVFRR